MNITILVTHYLPHIGGLEIATAHLATELVKQKNEVHIITPYPANSEENTYIHVHRHPINTYPDEPKLRTFIDGLRFFKKSIQTIKQIQPDLIHVQNITNSIPAYIVWRKYKIPYVICIHGDLELMGPFLPQRFKRFWGCLPYIKHAAKIISLTQEMGNCIEENLGKKTAIIPNGVDIDCFFPDLEMKETTSHPILVTLSRIDEKKGIEYAIQSMPKILEKHPKTKLRIVGEGEYRGDLELLVKELSLQDSVEFVGFIPNIEVPVCLRSSDIFLLPSSSEGFSLVAIEAMACGLPIVSTPVGIIPEMVGLYQNGIIVPFKSPEAIAEAVDTLLSNPDRMQTMRKNSADAAKQTTSWKSVAEQYAKLYQSILEEK